jgi:hypothetical protein
MRKSASKIFLLIVIACLIFFLNPGCTQKLDNTDDKNSITNDSQDEKDYEAELNMMKTKKVMTERDCKEFLARIFVDHFKSKKINLLLSRLTNDIEWKVVGDIGEVPFAGIYNGKKEVKKYLIAFFNSIKIIDISLQYNLIENNLVNTHIDFKAFVPKTKKQFQIEFVFASELTDFYKIKKMTIYYDTYNFYCAYLKEGPKFIKDYRSDNLYFDRTITGSRDYVMAGYNDFLNQNLPGLLDKLSDNVLWILKGNSNVVPVAGVYHGKEGVVNFITTLLQNSYYTGLNILYTVEEGNRVDFHVKEELIVYATNKKMSVDIVQSFIVENGKMIEFESTNNSYNVVKAYTPDK